MAKKIKSIYISEDLEQQIQKYAILEERSFNLQLVYMLKQWILQNENKKEENTV